MDAPPLERPPEPPAELKAELARLRADVLEARRRIARRVKGAHNTVTLMLVALGARGHVLLEGAPGVGKTTLANAFARVTGLEFKRIQLTPDLMPADVTGYTVYDPRDSSFRVHHGPVFTNVLLADELNRTPPRTQAALLEVMQEQQVTIEGETHPVPDPFLVIATKNPIEVEGVYNLPEAELDRFMVSIRVRYPDRATEAAILDAKLSGETTLPIEPIPDLHHRIRKIAQNVHVHPELRKYLLDIVRATRDHPALAYGASPRAAEHLLRAAQAHAALDGRTFVIPDDVRDLAYPVLTHRLILSAEAEIEEVRAEELLDEILDANPPPVAPERPVAPDRQERSNPGAATT